MYHPCVQSLLMIDPKGTCIQRIVSTNGNLGVTEDREKAG